MSTKSITRCAFGALFLLALSAVFTLGFGSRRAAILGGSISNAIRVSVQSHVQAATPIQPHTITMVQYLTSGSGNTTTYRHARRLEGRSIDALDSDGSRVHYVTIYQRTDDAGHQYPAFDEGTVFDVKHQKRVIVQKFLNSRTTYPLSSTDIQNRPKGMPTAASDCLLTADGQQAFSKRAFLGRDKVLGYDTVIIGNAGTRDWRAPALGCDLVRTEHTFYDRVTGQILSFNEQYAESILVGPVDQSLFDPAGVELKPSDSYKRKLALWDGKYGIDAAKRLQQESAKLFKQDTDYAARNGLPLPTQQ